MNGTTSRGQRAVPVVLGVVTLLGVVVLLAWDVRPGLFPAGAHDILGAFPLAMIAFAYLLYQAPQRPSSREWVRTVVLATAFLFWAANQMWPNLREATLFNDVAIALFVLDVFLVIVGWPASGTDGAFGEG